ADGDRSFADRRRAALDRSAAYVARREDAGQARFEEEGLAVERAPRLGIEHRPRDRGAGHDERLRIEFDAAAEPSGVRVGADEQEQRRRRNRRLGARSIADADAGEVPLAIERGHDGAAVHVDVGQVLDAVHEIPRHARREIVAAHDDVHVAGELDQVHNRLSGGVARADHDHLLVAAKARFHFGRGVIDPGALEFAEPRHVEAAVADAGGNQHGARPQLRPVHERDDAHAVVDPEPRHGARHGDARAEPLRLDERVARQLRARDAGRKSEVVFDARARARLTAGRDRLEHDDVETLRRAVQRRGEACRTAADDDQVVRLLRIERDVQAGAASEIFDGWIAQEAPFAADHHRRRRRRNVEVAQDPFGLRVGLEVDPGEGDGIPRGEVAQTMRVGGEARPDDSDAGETAVEQQRAAREKRLDDDLAELRELVDGMAQIDRAHLEDLALDGGAGRDQRRAAGQHVDVAGEFLRLVDDDRVRGAAGVLDDLDRAGEHDVEAEAAIAFGKQDVAGVDRARVSALPEGGDLRGRQPREGQVAIAERWRTHRIDAIKAPRRRPAYSCAMKRVLPLVWCAAATVALSAQAPRTVIAVAALIDGRGQLVRNTRIVVEGRRIARIDPTASPIDYDLQAATLMPGWIDTHVHVNWHFDANGRSVNGGEPADEAALATAADAWATLQGGFTTVQSVGAAIDGRVRDAINRGLLPGPRILTSLRQIQDRSGDPDALRALVRRTKDEGADVSKLFATTGLGAGGNQSMSSAQIQATCGEARAVGLRSVVHAIGDAGA